MKTMSVNFYPICVCVRVIFTSINNNNNNNKLNPVNTSPNGVFTFMYEESSIVYHVTHGPRTVGTYLSHLSIMNSISTITLDLSPRSSFVASITERNQPNYENECFRDGQGVSYRSHEGED
jgi:hypothetical protein